MKNINHDDEDDLGKEFQNKCEVENKFVEDEKPADINEVLVEKDGKFELVNQSDLKSLPLNNGNDTRKANAKRGMVLSTNKRSRTTDLSRPKSIATNDTYTQRPFSNIKSVTTHIRQPNPEYAHIISRYAMTAQQLEMKRRREELIARRKKEEEIRKAEELELQRQEAEKAFEAWLKQKRHSVAMESRQESYESQSEKPSQNEIDSVFKGWLAKKTHQMKHEHLLDLAKQEEQAACYSVRNQNLCDEAYKRWKRNKLHQKTSKSQFHQKHQSRTFK